MPCRSVRCVSDGCRTCNLRVFFTVRAGSMMMMIVGGCSSEKVGGDRSPLLLLRSLPLPPPLPLRPSPSRLSVPPSFSFYFSTKRFCAVRLYADSLMSLSPSTPTDPVPRPLPLPLSFSLPRSVSTGVRGKCSKYLGKQQMRLSALPHLRPCLIVAATQVYGMRNKHDNFPVKLGGGKYDLRGRPIQTFAIE